MAVLNTNTRYLHDQLTAFAEELLATFPPQYSVVHFVNSGSEANELALRMAEAWSGSRQMVAVEVGYHGNTGHSDKREEGGDQKGNHHFFFRFNSSTSLLAGCGNLRINTKSFGFVPVMVTMFLFCSAKSSGIERISLFFA